MRHERRWLSVVGAMLVAAICLSGAKCGAPHITLSKDSSSFSGIALSSAQAMLEENGFTNIKTEEVPNEVGSNSTDTISAVTINGEEDVKKGTELSADAPVVIQYFGEYAGSGIAMPEASSAYEDKPASEVVDELKELGFKNVGTSTEANDKGEDAAGTVEYVSMGGRDSFEKGETFEADITIVVHEYGSYGAGTAEDEDSETSSHASASEFPTAASVWEKDTGDGYTIKATAKFGVWVKASDDMAVEAAWRATGTTDEFPGVSSILGSCKGDYKPNSSILTFATVQLNNETEGWDIDASNPLRVIIWSGGYGSIGEIDLKQTNGSNPEHWSGLTFYSDTTYPFWQNDLVIDADMERNQFGPVVVCFVVGDAFGPSYGTGHNPAIDDLVFYAGDDRDIRLPFSWVE